MKPRRILIFSLAYYPLRIGGAEVAVKEITDRIPGGEIEFDMIALNGGAEAPQGKIGNVTVHRLFKKFGPFQKLIYPFAAASLAKKLQKERGYDAVWAIMASYAGYAGFLFKKMFPDIPLVLTIQEGDHFGRREGLLFPLFKKIFTAADRIQCISNYLAEWCGRMGATCPIDVVPNGVDTEFFETYAKQVRDNLGAKSIFRSSYGFTNEDIVLVTASRLVHKNAVDMIIKSLEHLPVQYKLLILGTGHEEQSLRDIVKVMKLDSRVVFKGFVGQEGGSLASYLGASDIFVRPSRSEGLGNSFLEAMAAGIPVIATPVGGIPDFLTDGETGLFCEVDNPRSIAQKAEKFTKDRESREYIVAQAAKMVHDKYGWTKIALAMKDILVSAKPIK